MLLIDAINSALCCAELSITKRIIQSAKLDIPFLSHTQHTTLNAIGQTNCFVKAQCNVPIINGEYVHEYMLRKSSALGMLHPNYIGSKQKMIRPFAAKTLCHTLVSYYVSNSRAVKRQAPFTYKCKAQTWLPLYLQGPLLLTWFNFNSNMD